MADSILTSVKKVLGIDETYTAYDLDILMHINTVFTVLTDLGVGPDAGFSIEDASVTWDTYLGTDLRLNSVKSYMYLRVRMLFDPPTTSYLLEAMNKQIEELTVRINMVRESVIWTDPNPPVIVSYEDILFDGLIT